MAPTKLPTHGGIKDQHLSRQQRRQLPHDRSDRDTASPASSTTTNDYSDDDEENDDDNQNDDNSVHDDKEADYRAAMYLIAFFLFYSAFSKR